MRHPEFKERSVQEYRVKFETMKFGPKRPLPVAMRRADGAIATSLLVGSR